MSVARRKATLLVQYFEHLEPVEESEVLVIRMKAYNLVLGLPWQETRKSTAASRLTALRSPKRLQRAKIPEADRRSPLPERGEGHKA